MGTTNENVLTAAQQAALAEAITRAEAGTAGEIQVVVSSRPLIDHPFYALMWAAVIALVLPWPVALLLQVDVPELLALQASVFILLGSLLAFTPLRHFCVPRAVLRAAARGTAVDHFLSLGIHQTEGRTGVLIFVALPDHRVEVVADDTIHARVGPSAWTDVCTRVLTGAREGRLAEGLEDAIAEAGRLLARHAPPDTHKDELPNRIVVL
ncbi:Uncharacterised protein [Starkeya nomas]|uniref:TPM domain-containing protein n=1 Tax=Starkeya nomas TaxID=2666134 RepID=A0A5S9NWN1_9HYPH|nr:hypothetical protein [Starkeya nomas]CAA0095166.1 Uncharacterised protein [Starkeya nomas]